MRAKKPNRLKDQCLLLWRLLVIQDSPRICPICNDEPVSDAHHLIGRTFWRRKCFWSKKNGLGVGRKCHKYPSRIKDWLMKNRPRQYRWLMRNTRKIKQNPKPPPIDLKKVQKSLMEQF